METISIASLGKPFGIKGEVVAYLMTDFPELRFKKGRTYYFVNAKDEIVKEVTLASFRPNGNTLILRFNEIPTPEEIAEYRNHYLNISREEAPLPKGAIRYADIIGFALVNEEGKPLGELIEVVTYSPTPNLKAKKEDGKIFYVPFNDFFVKKVDEENKQIIIHEIGGLV